MHTLSIFSLLRGVCVALALLCLAPLSSRAEAYGRWAVITSGTEEEGQLSDLVLAELTRVPGLELVEREALAKLADEQALSGALSAEGSASRLKLGRMLRADALVLTKLTGPEQNRELQLTVAECKAGARLRVETLPWKTENLPILVEHVKALVLELRARFANGITQVYAVPSFVSQSLSRDYDPLQARYAQLIENALSLQPGVAVLEIAEARALGKELAIGAPELQRLVPAFIAGEFRVEPRPEKEATITLTVTASDGAKTLDTMQSAALPLSAAAQWISETVTPKLLARTGAGKPLTVAEQIAALTERAETFAKLGSLEEALPLRESVLLLQPDNTPLRETVFNEYCRVVRHDTYSSFNWMKDPGDVQTAERFIASRIDAYLAAMDHLEVLIRNRQISGDAALMLLDTMRQSCFVFHLTEFARFVKDRPGLQPRIQALREANCRFIDAVTPLILAMTTGKDRYIFLNNWQAQVVSLAEYHLARERSTEEDAAFLRHVLLDLVPDGVEVSWDALVRYSDFRVITPFCESLINSDRPMIRVLGRSTLLRYQFSNAQVLEKDVAHMQQLADDYAGLLKDYTAIPYPCPVPEGITRNTDYGYQGLQRNYAAMLKEIDTLKNTAPPVQVGAIGALKFEPVKFTVIDEHPPFSEGIDWQRLRFVPCTEILEVATTPQRIYRHDRPGELRMILSTFGLAKNVQFDDLAWDGQHLWVAAVHDGLWVATPEGKVVMKVTPELGLPEADKMLLYALGRGRVLAVGSFGVELRSWCAVVEWNGRPETAPTVRLIHEAKRLLEKNETQQNPQLGLDPSVGFTPLWIQRITDKANHPILLIGRLNLNAYYYSPLHPLTIDLQTLAVGVLPTPVYQFIQLTDPPRSFYSANDRLFGFGIDDCVRAGYYEFSDEPVVDPVKVFRHIPVTNPLTLDPNNKAINTERKVKFIGDNGRPLLVPAPDGWVYAPGKQWWRFNPKTVTGERLAPGVELPEPYWKKIYNYVYSQRLGLLAFGVDSFYRVTIDETKIPKAGD
jgi:hypothetical protein